MKIVKLLVSVYVRFTASFRDFVKLLNNALNLEHIGYSKKAYNGFINSPMYVYIQKSYVQTILQKSPCKRYIVGVITRDGKPVLLRQYDLGLPVYNYTNGDSLEVWYPT